MVLGEKTSGKGVKIRAGLFNKAKSLCNTAENPNLKKYGRAYNNYILAEALRCKDHIWDAIDEYQKAIELRPDYYEAHYGLAVAYKRVGHIKGAIEEFNAAKNISPEQPAS